MTEDLLLVLYFPTKLALYSALLHYALRKLGPPGGASVGAAMALGLLRLVMGFLVAIPLGLAGLALYDVFPPGVAAMALTYLMLYPPTRWVEWGVMEYLVQPKGWAFLRPTGIALNWRIVAVALSSVPDAALFSLGPDGPFRIYMC